MGAVQKLGKFLGVNKFGEALAGATRTITGEVGRDVDRQAQANLGLQKILYAARNETNPEKKKRLLDFAKQQGGIQVTAEEIDPTLKTTTKEIIGSAANVGLNVLTPGAFKGGKAAILGKNAALGAGFGVAQGLEKDRSAKGVVGSAVGGALIGTALGAGGLAIKAAKNFFTKTTPVWLMNKAVKPALSELKKNIKYGTPTLGEELLKEGVKGGPHKLLDIADNQITGLEDDLQRIINDPNLAGARIDRQKLASYLGETLRQKSNTPGTMADAQKIRGIFESIPQKLSLPQAQQMKRDIYNELGDIAYKLDPRLSTKAQTLKSIAKGLKEQIEETVGGTVVRDINKRLAIYGKLRDSITDQLSRSLRNNGIGLTDAILIGGGNLKPAGFIAAIAKHILGGPAVETGAANLLYKGRNIGTGTAGQAVKGAVQRGVLNLP